MRLDSLVPETRRSATVRLEVHLEAEELARTLRSDARSGLGRRPRQLPPKWFYDERGMELFEEITRLPEYYPTRREREILLRHAGDIARATRATLLVELGSGTSDKTRLLLSALRSEGTLRAFAPFDVSEPTLRRAALAIAGEHPGLHIHAVVGDFERHLGHLPGGSTRLIAFLGGTVGNLEPAARASFLRTLAHQMGPSDALLLGTDLVKDIPRLEAAYNDRRGVTAEFNRNVLRVLNRELGADFVLERFEHLARYDARQGWIEMYLRSTEAQTVHLPELPLVVQFGAGELLRTEISAKFRPDQVEAELAAAGLRRVAFWTDDGGDFGLSLAMPAV
ncbi:MAG TPA: L-histidine N(alpha)-methyltransferase [Myxococcaceae bacterium]|nr:L-histidine N(alpha)-methyltransferase [Myxococcaceae bacterium]